MDDMTRQLILLIHCYGPAELTLKEVNGTAKTLAKIIRDPKRWSVEDLKPVVENPNA